MQRLHGPGSSVPSRLRGSVVVVVVSGGTTSSVVEGFGIFVGDWTAAMRIVVGVGVIDDT